MFKKILAAGLASLLMTLSPWQGHLSFAASSKTGARINPNLSLGTNPSLPAPWPPRHLSGQVPFSGEFDASAARLEAVSRLDTVHPDNILLQASKPIHAQQTPGLINSRSPAATGKDAGLASQAARDAQGLLQVLDLDSVNSGNADSELRSFYDIQKKSEESPDVSGKEGSPSVLKGYSPPKAEKQKQSPLIPQTRTSASAGLKASYLLLAALAGTSALGVGLFWSGLGLPFQAGAMAMAGIWLFYALILQPGKTAAKGFLARLLDDPQVRQALEQKPKTLRLVLKALHGEHEKILEEGGEPLSEARAPEFFALLKAQIKGNALEIPTVYVMPRDFPFQALTLAQAGSRETFLLVRSDVLSSPELPRPGLGRPGTDAAEEILIASRPGLGRPGTDAAEEILIASRILAHEVQHLKDQRSSWLAFPGFALASLILGFAIGAVHAVTNPWDWNQAAQALWAIGLSVPGAYALKFLLRAILEWRAILVEAGGWGVWNSLRAAVRFAKNDLALKGPLKGGLGSSGPTSADDKKPEYYRSVPDWAKGLRAEREAFQNQAKLERYQEELESLRPLARWMARFYVRLREQGIQRPPNLLTLQDALNWAAYARKFESEKGWDLGLAVAKGIDAMFLNALPAEKHEGRDLRAELEQITKDLGMEKRKRAVEKDGRKIEIEEWALPHWLKIPQKLARSPLRLEEIQGQKGEMEALDESSNLFEAAEVGALESPDYILTETVRERLRDLVTLYSTDHKKKFFPLIIGPTGEGKSSLIQYLFTLPEVRGKLGGRAVPVVPIPVKEGMTRRELLGGKGARGIELGFLALAAMNGWVLVLEELNQANGEFLKALNDVLHQIRKQGAFEFEVGGQTIRIKAHPHFWVAGTENPEEGNYAFSRNPHPPDFMKRWVVRYYDRIPPAEQAEIMLGLAAKWHGADFAKRHGLNLNFFENLVTLFHEKVREMAASGKLGGDNQEPYEFNRRTLHRFLRRYLHDLQLYESEGRRLDKRTRHLLLARELMEAYGIELRAASERQALWDKMNVVFKLQGELGIERKDIQLKITGLYRKGNVLIVEEGLVSLELPIRGNGGSRVPGPEHGLTLVPSLARSVYRSLRNRQFKEPEFSTGPTGTAKTSKQHWIAHLLGEPLFSITLDEMTPIGEFHGGYLKDAETGEFLFKPGVVARAMMHDPEGLLKRKNGKMPLSAAEARRLARLGATLVVNEGNSNTNLETINPVFDNGVLNLRDGQHAAVAGAGFHIAVTWNPVGEGYVGYPMSPAFTSRGQTVWHPSDPADEEALSLDKGSSKEQKETEAQRLKGLLEEELAEIILDQLTGVVRHQIVPDGK